MSTIPTICPNCYKTIHAPVAMPDGFVRCNSCGHAFPPSGSSPYGSSPPLVNPGPAVPTYGNSPPPFPGSAPYGSGTYQPQPSYPSAAGPSGNPGLMACGVIAGLGLLFAACCGGVGFFAYSQARQLAEQEIPPLVQPPQPIPVPVFPNTPNFPDTPFIPNDPAPVPVPVFPPIPGTPPANPLETSQSLDAILARLNTSSPNDFSTSNVLNELNAVPVDEARRSDVVAAVLKCLEGGNVISGNSARPVLLKWTTKSQSNLLAKFAAGDFDTSVRRMVVEVIAQQGGDAETARTLVPALEDISLSFAMKAALLKIGPDAEAPLLDELERTTDRRAKRMICDVLGEIGTDKAKNQLAGMVDTQEGLDKIYVQRALEAMQRRGK